MTLCVDTSVLISLEKGRKSIIDKFDELSKQYPQSPAISYMTYFEFIHGIFDRNTKNKEKAILFLNDFTMLHPTKETAFILSKLKHKYDKEGTAILLGDLFIAAQAIEHHLTLVTKDSIFQKIKEIKIITLS